MPYCSDCGRYTESQAFTCRHCGGPMQYAPPPPRPQDVPPPSAFQNGPELYLADEQEKFLSQYAMGAGCGFYYWSAPLIWYYLAALGLSLLFSAFAPLAIFGWAGSVTRRIRWENLKWRDFEHFRRDEKAWELFGAMGFIFLTLFAISFVIYLVNKFSGAVASATP
jgi:hypothetical protein